MLLLGNAAVGLHGDLEVGHGLEGEPHVEGDHGPGVHPEDVQHPDYGWWISQGYIENLKTGILS